MSIIMKIQIGVYMPLFWKQKLKKIAAEQTISTGQETTYLDLIRQAIREKHNLPLEESSE